MINSINAIGTQSKAAEAQNSGLEQADFLKLLTTELKNQDPDSPMDSQNMLEQFSTLSNVQAIGGLTKMMSEFFDKQNSNSVLEASGMIGKTISFISNDYKGSDGLVKGSIEPPSGTTSVQVNLKNSLGEVVSQKTIDTTDSDFNFDFEFKDVPAGDYFVDATYVVDGQENSLDVFQSSLVESVRMESGVPLLKLGNGRFAMLSDIVNVHS